MLVQPRVDNCGQYYVHCANCCATSTVVDTTFACKNCHQYLRINPVIVWSIIFGQSQRPSRREMCFLTTTAPGDFGGQKRALISVAPCLSWPSTMIWTIFLSGQWRRQLTKSKDRRKKAICTISIPLQLVNVNSYQFTTLKKFKQCGSVVFCCLFVHPNTLW